MLRHPEDQLLPGEKTMWTQLGEGSFLTARQCAALGRNPFRGNL